MGVEIDVGGDADPEPEEMVGDADLEMKDTEVVDTEEEDMLEEALSGISYVPGKKEIVNEVAKRVAKRLLKAQRAQKNLQEALGAKRK